MSNNRLRPLKTWTPYWPSSDSGTINRAPSQESRAAEDAKIFAQAKPGPVATPENKPEGQQNAQDLEPTKQELHSFLYRAGAKYQEILNEREREVAARDFDGVVSRTQKAVTDAGLHVPSDYAATILKARALEDAELVRAFDDRNKSPQHQQQFNRLINKITAGIVSKARQDQEFAEGAAVQADRDLIASVMRGASSGKPIPEAPKNYGAMTDAEYSAEKKRIGLD